MKFFKNQKWLFLLVMLSLRTPEILSEGFEAEPETSITSDSNGSEMAIRNFAKEREEHEDFIKPNSTPKEELPIIKNPKDAFNLFNLPETATLDDVKRKYKEQSLKNHPDKGGSPEKMKQVNTARDVLAKYFEELNTSKNIVEKPKSKLQKFKDGARKAYETAEAASKKVLKNFEDWLNSLSKQTSIEEAKQNITDQRNKKAEIFKNRGLDAIKKEVLENVTAQDLKQRAAKEVKQFEDQVGSLSSGAYDSVGVFAKRLKATQDIYTENAELLQKQYNQYGIPKIVVVGHPPKNLDPESYAFNIIDLGQKEVGSGQTFQEHLDRMLENDAIPTTFDSEKIKEFNEKLFAKKPDTSIQNLKKEFLKIAYEMKVRQDLTLATPEIIKQLVEYVIKKKAQIAEDAL